MKNFSNESRFKNRLIRQADEVAGQYLMACKLRFFAKGENQVFAKLSYMMYGRKKEKNSLLFVNNRRIS